MASSGTRDYRGLLAWQHAMDLVEIIYRITEQSPSSEQFGLMSQIRRAAVSIPSNIAEGQGRYSPGDFARFLGIAHGSLHEVETQLLIADRLGFSSKEEFKMAMAKAAETGRCIQGLFRTVRAQTAHK